MSPERLAVFLPVEQTFFERYLLSRGSNWKHLFMRLMSFFIFFIVQPIWTHVQSYTLAMNALEQFFSKREATLVELK